MFAFVRRSFLAALAALLAAGAMAQPAPGVEAPAYSQGELESLLAPIALYPDPLLAQVLMAATYPLEVVQAARWSRAHPDLIGEEAVRAVDGESWDPSVKSLVAFPQLVQTMDERIGWTQRLGEAFLGDTAAAMETVQRLRRAADERGNLAPGDEIAVQREGEDIVLEPASPDMVYVPYYDPRVVYGEPWDAQYPPVYWAPWPGYFFTPGYAFAWTLGIPVGYSFFYGNLDWHGHHVSHREHRPFYYHGRYPHGEWRHDARHRHGVAYQDPRVHSRYGQRQHSPRPADGPRPHGTANSNRTAAMPDAGFFKPQVPGAARPGLAAPDASTSTPLGKPMAPVYRGTQPAGPHAAPQIAHPGHGPGANAPSYGSLPPAPAARVYSPGPAQPHAPMNAQPLARPAPHASAPAMPAVPHAMPSAPAPAMPSAPHGAPAMPNVPHAAPAMPSAPHAAPAPAPARAAPAPGVDVGRAR